MNLQSKVLKTLDKLSINYEGEKTDKVFAYTITSRIKFKDVNRFREELYKFLSDIKYKYAIQGYCEFHNQKSTQDKLHCHAVGYFGNPPKDNKTNPFSIRIKKLDNPDGWKNYSQKEIMFTLEQLHDIKTGLFYYNKKRVLLFND